MPPASPVAKQLIYIALGSFVLQMVLQVWLGLPIFQLLALRGGSPGVDDLWRLFTHPFVWPPGPDSVFGLAFVCLGFWWMVSPIEGRYGARGAWTFVALALLAGAFCARLVGLFLPGSVHFGTGAVFLGAIAVFAFTMRSQVVHLFGVLALQAMHVLYIALGFSALRFLTTQDFAGLAADLGAVGAGWWFVERGGALGGERRRRKPRRRRGNLRVVEPEPKSGDDDRPRWLN
jgi:hypothetical protein